MAVTWTIMHKRTASFLLPASAIWLGLGCEYLWRRFHLSPRGIWIGSAVVITLIALQAGRVLYNVRVKGTVVNDPASFVQASLLREAGVPMGRIWAFGGEPEIYYFWGNPEIFPFFQMDSYLAPYRQNRGNPAAFVSALRAVGFSYLCVTVPRNADRAHLADEGRSLGSQESNADSDVQPNSDDFIPLPSDLLAVSAHPAQYGLHLVGSRIADAGHSTAYVFLVR
jgi:hypothetical protein